MPTPAEIARSWLKGTAQAAPVAGAAARTASPLFGGGSALTPTQRARQWLVTPETEQEPQEATGIAKFIGDLPEPIREGVGGALRSLARTLEPLQLPQDAMFAVIAGAVDPNTTIAQRLSRMDLLAYLPGGEAPERPASGEEIFSLLGFDENVSKWAGIGADLIADPLLMGSWLRVAGKVSKTASLIQLGNRFDHLTSPLGVAQELNKFARRSDTIRVLQDRRVEQLFTAIRNPDSVVFGIQRFGEKATNLASKVLSKETMLRVRLGDEAGREVWRIEQKASALGRRVSEDSLVQLQRAMWGVPGDRRKDFVTMYLRTAEEQMALYEALQASMKVPAVRDAIESGVVTLANKAAGVGLVSVAEDVADIADPVLRRLVGETRGALTSSSDVAAQFVRQRAAHIDNEVEPFRRQVAEIAEREAKAQGLAQASVEKASGDAVAAFNDFLQGTISIDARLGFHTSGYGYVSDGIRTRVLELNGTADQANETWQQVLLAGMLDGPAGIEELKAMPTALRITTPLDLAGKETARRLDNQRKAMDAMYGYRDYLQSIKDDAAVAAAAKKGVRVAEDIGREAAFEAAGQVRQMGRSAEDAARELKRKRVEGGRAGVEAREVSRRESELSEAMGGIADLPERMETLMQGTLDLAKKLTPTVRAHQAVMATINGNGALRKAVIRYRAKLDAVLDADVLTGRNIAELANAERAVERQLGRQAERLDGVWRVMTEGGRSGPLRNPRAGKKPSRDFGASSPVNLPDIVADLQAQAAQLRADVASVAARKTSIGQRVAEQTAAFAAGRKATAQEFTDAERAARAARVAEDRTARQEFAAESRQVRADRRTEDAAAREQAKIDEVARRIAREEAGLPREGSRADYERVAREAIAQQGKPRGLYQPALAVDGSNNTTVENIMAARRRNALREAERGIRSELGPDDLTDEALAKAPITFGELLDGIADMQALDLGEYLHGLLNGHLRRAYGLFLDGNSFDRYIDRVSNGGIVISNVIDELKSFNDILPQRFRDEARMLSEYHAGLRATGGGYVLRRDSMIEFLESRGVSANRINDVMTELHRSMSNTPRFQMNIDLLRAYQSRVETELTGAVRRINPNDPTPRVTNKLVFAERVDIGDDLRAILGEHAMASLSIAESADYARRVISRQDYYQQILQLAEKYGLVKNEEFMNEYGAVYRRLNDAPGTMGGFGGRTIHPYLLKELERFSTASSKRSDAAFQRIRALITGGYLASPSVLAANFIGGLYQAATVGMAPWTMLKRMGEVLPDMLAARKGQRTELLDNLMRDFPDIEMTGLVNSEMASDFSRLVKARTGLGPEGAQKTFDDVASWYEGFLQRPFGLPFAGLDGFQFTENWFKVAAYKEMREYLMKNGAPGARAGSRITLTPVQIGEQAADYARNVVFDYSSLPDSLDRFKRTGLVMFPGFAYYLAGRTIDTAIRRPGVLAVSDRLSEALANASMSIEDQVLAYVGMPQWLQDEQGSPLPFSAVLGKGDNKQVSLIPMAQLVPTTTVWDGLFGGGLGSNPWAESIAQLGLWGPLVDIIGALASGSGEAGISGRYGHRVFDAGAEGAEKNWQVLRFLYNTMAPSVVRKTIRVDYDGRMDGLIPNVVRGFANLGEEFPNDLTSSIYTYREKQRGRPDETWRESMLSSFLRSPQVIPLEGPLSGIRKEFSRAQTAHNDEVSALMQRYNQARATGQTAVAAQLMERINGKRQEFADQWRDFLVFNAEYTRRRQAEKEAR